MKINFLLLFVLIGLFACSASKQTSNLNTYDKKNLKGTWTVSSVDFVGEKGFYKVELFDAADSKCFGGSTWVFIPNNGSGKYTINQSDQCEGMTKPIHWSFTTNSAGSTIFQFKYLDEKGKPKATTGYRTIVNYLDANTMKLRIPTQDGIDIDILYTKTSDDITL